jgi:hypothetical protein
MAEHAVLFSSSIIITLIAIVIPSLILTPWQLFQSICPYLSMQSPQCQAFTQQQQQQPFLPQSPLPLPSPQQQTPLCPDGSIPDANGNCPINQQPPQ